MSHQLIAFLGRCVKRYRVVDFVIGAEWNLRISAVHRGTGSVYKMFQILIISACLQNVEETDQVAVQISFGICNAVADACLCSQVYNDYKCILVEHLGDQCLVRNVSLNKNPLILSGYAILFKCFLNIFQTPFF